ncbi:class II fructose-bisphosphate aldolase [Flavivirga spongiicola]|uniref:Class II fructose-bisphosphate aldolase n=1 Tax=Flavivirga spongiicola TaxID=421621 RepID=A0ABU7XP44_9FLAO|nr:class II fructose-bisphosphate aldolase [Flavivirga sp. MEBiC05379]MDO5977340.1 class II fructose-bisphosphate aldolase [Flavivirga sp. MEBiC05379]
MKSKINIKVVFIMGVSPTVFYKNCYSKYAIAAVNVFTMEQIHGLFKAGQRANAPFIVQMTPVARNYAHSKMLLAMIDAAAKIYPKAVYAIHLDHGNEPHAFDAITSNSYNSVMIDASHDNFETNISRTKTVVEAAHKNNVVVEAELGVLSGVEDDISIDEKHAKYTQPSEVVDFVNQTNCDSLAVAVGTSHGAYKFSGGQGIQFDILKEIQKRLPNFPIVLHGGSAVNKEEINRINKNGGSLNKEAAGVAPEEIVKAITYGVCKINIATDTRLIWARVHREFFNTSPELFDPIIPGQKYMEAYETFMLEKFDLLKATGKVSQLKI